MIAKWPVPFRVSGWACVALIACLSLAPHEMQVMTGLPEIMEDFVPAGMEHIIAYAGTAFFLRLGYPRQSFWRISLALFIYSAGLELLQASLPAGIPALTELCGAGWVHFSALASQIMPCVASAPSARDLCGR
jgi:hypothetical protein